MSDPAELCHAILTGDAPKAEQLTKAALAAHVHPAELLSRYLIPAIDEVGRRYDRHDYSMTRLMTGARAMFASLELITPRAELYEAILSGDHQRAREVTKAALAASVAPAELVSVYVTPAMEEVGRRFECNELYVPELLIAQRAMKAAVALLGTAGDRAGRVVIGTVQGDLHDIGKNLVAAMLQGCGFEVIDLQVDVPPEKFVAAAQEKEGTIVAMSALLTTTMTMMKRVIDALEEAGIREKTKVIIGGAPITQQYCNQIGADGYSDNANGAVALARKLAGART